MHPLHQTLDVPRVGPHQDRLEPEPHERDLGRRHTHGPRRQLHHHRRPDQAGCGDVGGRAHLGQQWYENTVYSRLNVPNDDVIILVMQRVHVDDLIGHVLEKEKWTYLDIPAIADEQRVYDLGRGGRYTREAGEVLHPDRLNHAELDNIKANIGTYNFEAQYQQRPVPPGGALIKWAWFQTYDQVPDLSAFDLRRAELGHRVDSDAVQRLLRGHDLGRQGMRLLSARRRARAPRVSLPTSSGV